MVSKVQKGTKRPAQEPAASEAKKLKEMLRKHGVTKSTYDGIVEAIQHPLAENLTDSVRQMLLAMLPEGLCVPEDKRHEAQSSYVNMVSEIFEGILKKLNDNVAGAAAEVARIEASKSGLELRVTECDEALQAATTHAVECKVKLADATKAVLTCKSNLGDKQKLQKEGDVAFQAAKAEKVALEGALSEDFRLLRDGEVEGALADTHYKKLEVLASNLDLEASLMSALPTCMVKKPAERGSFDTMVVAQLQDKLAKRVADLVEIIQSGEPSAAARQQAVDSAARDLDAAKQVQQQEAEALQAATDLQKACEGRRAEALLNVEQHEPQLTAAKKTVVDNEIERDVFQDRNLVCFKTLQNRQTEMKTKDMSEARQQLEIAAHLETAEAGA
ncbi:hypothetical protein AK812_SmicGene39122 [Symbiodinium microadriaticum]|uniref:Uncharacterized protein n=1 Tax=Symbiodinium microadriaticum TaxID=2951 RepID=A0A1Q9CC06_SYMMI|nr:hypothetical protein AK812_SmicGene39122 [Symbiodinium microadriaticum]CAE7878806.1 unnamed protein product [Symbiodinium sp. KB8]